MASSISQCTPCTILSGREVPAFLNHSTLLLCIVSLYGHVSQFEVQPVVLDLRSPAPQQANITSATFVTPDNQFTSGQLPAPNSPEYQPIGELTYQYLQICAAMSSWTPEKLHACALERPGADLAFWVGSFWRMISQDFSNSSHSLSISKSHCQSVRKPQLHHQECHC